MGLLKRIGRSVAWRARPWTRPLLRAVQGRIDAALEGVFRVKVYRNPEKGWDPYPAIARLRTWSEEDVIFDVGANDGRTVSRLRKHMGRARIFSFEPSSRTYEALVKRTRGMPGVYPYRLGLGSERGPGTMYLAPQSVCNSLLPDWSQPQGEEQIEIRTVDDLMEELGIPFIHFLKIDTEGYELEVLKGAERAIRESRIGIIQLEVSLEPEFARHTPFYAVRDLLAGTDYFLFGFFNQVMRSRDLSPVRPEAEGGGFQPRVLEYCDAVFVCAGLGVDRAGEASSRETAGARSSVAGGAE